jgi:hypothetical protein
MGKLDTVLRSLLAALVLLPACGGAPPSAADESFPDMVEPERPATLFLSPDPQLESVTRDWASKWSAETGLDVVVAPGGVPMHALERVTNGGKEVCGTTTITDGIPVLIEIDMTPPENCVGWGYMVGHEIGHALAGDPGHDEDGLMAQKPRLGVALTVDAGYVCSRVDCP